MKMLPSDPDIQTIVSRIDSGDLDLQPNFQRGEVWTTAKKRKLIDSILRDWHIPPIHVVLTDHGRQEVLDGQQRLVAIRDFVNGEFRVDGSTEPHDPGIEALSNLTYEQLPRDVKRAFDQFTIRIFRLTDYKAGEPGELFFRLNQMTHLTAAEQRNAFFGPVREQVKSIVQQLEHSEFASLFGFSNKRMAYDDVISRFLCTLESESLGFKLGAAEISNRFRSDRPFSDDVIGLADRSIAFFIDSLKIGSHSVRFNKATLFTWFTFVSRLTLHSSTALNTFSDFLGDFEDRRTNLSSPDFHQHQLTRYSPDVERALLLVFTDRSSSRVSDVSSVLFRDAIAWLFFWNQYPSLAHDSLPSRKSKALDSLSDSLRWSPNSIERALESHIDAASWGKL